MIVELDFVAKAIVSQELRHVALWDAGRNHKLSYFNGDPQQCSLHVQDAATWIEGNYLVEAWSDERVKGGRPNAEKEKCTWIVRGQRAGAASLAGAQRGAAADGGMMQMMQMMMARMDAMQQAINGVDDDDDDDEPEDDSQAELLREYKPVVERGMTLLEDVARKMFNVPAGGGHAPAPAQQPAPQAINSAMPAEEREYVMKLNRAIINLKNTNPEEFRKYGDMLLAVYGAPGDRPSQSASHGQAEQ